MIKLRITYLDPTDKDKLISDLNKQYKIIKVSKEYQSKEKSLYKKTYIDLSTK